MEGRGFYGGFGIRSDDNVSEAVSQLMNGVGESVLFYEELVWSGNVLIFADLVGHFDVLVKIVNRTNGFVRGKRRNVKFCGIECG